MDATTDAPYADRRADIAYIMDDGEDFRAVCELAGIDPVAMRERFAAGQVCSDAIRFGGRISTADPAGWRKAEGMSAKVVAWLREHGPHTVRDMSREMRLDEMSLRSAVMVALASGKAEIVGHRHFVTLYGAA